MTKYVKFQGTKFADTLGISTSILNQRLFGRAGSDVLLGGLANDKVKGGDGSDWIVGAGGNDDIDGGKGSDTAVYSGRFDEYRLTFKPNLDGTVQDLTAGRDGTDSLKKVEFLRFSDGIYDIASDTFQFFNQAPTLAAPAGITYNDSAADDTFGPVAAALSASDPNGDMLTYSLAGAAADDSLAGYDVAKSTGYGTMYLNSATGAYMFVPVSGAIEALKITSGVDFTFTISDGELSDSKTLVVTLNGVNDVASITGLGTGSVSENGPFTAGGAVSPNDPDAGDAYFQMPASLTGDYGYFVFNEIGSWEYVLAIGTNAVEQLGADDVRHDTLAVTSVDGTASGTIGITIHGSNDAPILQAPVGSDPDFGEDELTLSATMAFSDIDLTDAHTVTFTPIGHDFVGDFSAQITHDSTGGVQGAVSATYHLTREQFEAFQEFGGQLQNVQTYRVTIDDDHGGTSSQIITIPLAEILQGGGEPPVFTVISPPASFVPGQNLGQLVDNPFVLYSPLGLSFQGTLFFNDLDGGTHQVQQPDVSQAHVVAHSLNGAPLLAAPPVDPSALVWTAFVQEPNQVHWSVTLPEGAIRPMAQGELESIVIPIMIWEDGTGTSTTNIRIDLSGQTEIPSLLAPDTILSANSDITLLVLPPDVAIHQQVQTFDITEDNLVSGNTSHHHTLHGTITFVDPDRLDHPTISMTLTDPGVPLSSEIQALQSGFSYTVEQFGNYGMIHWTYDVPDSALDFLPDAAGELPYGGNVTIGAAFSVGELAGASTSIVNIALHGKNDPVVIPGNASESMTVALGGGAQGQFNYVDQDWWPDGHTVEFIPLGASHGHMFGGTGVEGAEGGQGGVPGVIKWFYSSAPDQVTGTLEPGQHDVFNVVVHDNSGSIAIHTIEILVG